MTLVQSPIAAGLLFLAAVALVVPMILRARGRGDKLAQIGTAED
jgi:putative tricarboxylic transport membrane protein